ncbi:MAG: hypothetical protein IKQ56_05915 [Lachnospiraceae bacterium]|nr:hypothetical protein [Lachnospiraceae bacterium]
MDENELLIDLTYRAGQPLKKKRDAASYEQDSDTVFSLYKQGVPGAVELVLGNTDKFLPEGSKPENKYNKIKELYISGSSVKKAKAIIEKETEDTLRLKVLPYLSYSVLKDFKLAVKGASGSGKISKGKIELIEDTFKQAEEEKKDNDRFVNKAADEQADETVDNIDETDDAAVSEEDTSDGTEQDGTEPSGEEETQDTAEEEPEQTGDGEEDPASEDTDESGEAEKEPEPAEKYDLEGLSDTEIVDLFIRNSDIKALIAFAGEKELGSYDIFKIKNFLRFSLYHADFNEKAFLDEVLNALKDIEGNSLWLCEYSFWQSLRPELFDVVVRFIAANYEFYDIAYVNMQVSKAQGDNPLLLKWMEMYVKIGLGSGDNGEEFQKNYKRIQRDGALGDRAISLLNALIFDQALAYKRLFEAEHDKCLNIEDRVYVRISNGISEQLDRLEEFLAGDYQNTMKPDEYRKTIMTLVGSLRRGMDKCGLNYVISPTDWSTGTEIDFVKGDHVEFKNEAEEGDKVKPLSLGLGVNNGTYIQPAKVMKKS